MPLRPLLLGLALAMASSLAQAQAIVLTHTGYLLDSSDQPLSATLPMTFGIYDAPSGGSLLWTGDAGGGAACQVSVVAGYYAVQLGGTGPGSCGTALASAVFGSGTRHLELTINAVTLAPRQPLAAVPRAELASRALDADTLGGLAPGAFAATTHDHATLDLTGFDDAAVSAVTASGAFASASHAHAAADGATSGFLSAADWTTFNSKLSAETDPKVGTITEGQWCTASGGKVACTSAAPTGSGGQATGGVASPAACSNATAGYFWYDGSVPAVMVCNGASYETLNTVTAPPGPPGAPTVSAASGLLGVSWSAASGATSYEVGYQAGSVINASATVVAVASGTTTTLSGLTNDIAYAVAVRTIAGGWTSGWSATTGGTPALAPQVTSLAPTSGSTTGGTLVTISGSGFAGGAGASVTIGGAACTGATWNSGTITCSTPAGTSGARDVVVTSSTGASGMLAGGFSYFAAFTYTGAVQTFTVPAGVYSLNVTAQGGAGASSFNYGGYGGYVSGVITTVPGAVFNVYVGQMGRGGSSSNDGWGGSSGGSGFVVTSGLAGLTVVQAASVLYAGGGGGSSEVRSGTNTKLLVAGGGGSGGGMYAWYNLSPYMASNGLLPVVDGGTAGAGGATGTGADSVGCGGPGGGGYVGGRSGACTPGSIFNGTQNIFRAIGAQGEGGSSYIDPSVTGQAYVQGLQTRGRTDGLVTIVPQ